jgi:Zn-dependent M16 (insulinase) family peptidase
LTYFRAINTLDNLPDELRALIPLFTDSIMRLGTKDLTMEQIEDLIKLKTGGISVGYHSTSSPTDFRQATEGISLYGMALDRNIPDMFDLLQKLILETNFESPEASKQIRQLLEAASDGVVSAIASSGHSYAWKAAEAGLTRDAWLGEQVSGLSQVKLTASLAGRPETDKYEDVIDKLKQIQNLALAGSNIRAALTCGADSVSANSNALAKFMSTRPTEAVGFPSSQPQTLSRDIKAFYPLPYQVY